MRKRILTLNLLKKSLTTYLNKAIKGPFVKLPGYRLAHRGCVAKSIEMPVH